ncbi:protein RTF2 homolog isoform X1 [Selaginella moellendorffii]|uniref:protein RTF2 homolog isoform X1 n=1 Tax=Selaginella moellendorffii TaxID=88036 RepID=UPI000D1D091F|nr:protein RTF2 homolog isoform X1 [Selaginella moellendorffii]XP_024515700.1 protein RTF2 homolog isoform X1 [Selaginella moellendorffii]XP_024515701.1 protein RTF2 homolog isoform X1 [Selaginella moellendorffii]XP_024515702.1 protein RTF2 homolog isoform X1 [Selaginella moellendorffii]XP_024515703.1 protein RTF2 homolog isoform X1 [Selaginella moellendorffii]XP_024515704.1 protein RTF2 homolog isoform X1 [Selaginella moellendorffii]|eukprot:XP_024515699.1 protein RTF2 homolog isoform X1 [Selaginella moellendorffii]
MQIFVRSESSSSCVEVGRSATAGDVIQALLPRASSHDAFYLSHGGKLLGHGRPLQESGVGRWSTLHLGVRVRGGGGDGGATGAESRDCYLKMYAEKKPDKVDPNEARLARWCQCALSCDYLRPPCVMDPLGNLYNKEALVHALITKSLPKKFRHIRGLKDLTPVHLSAIPGVDPDDEHVETKFQCPVSGQEFNGKFKFVALKNCGHVLSVRALKEVQSSSCLVCFAEFKAEDKIPLNGTDEEVGLLRERMEAERAAARRVTKKEKNGESRSNVGAVIESIEGGSGEDETNSNKRKDAPPLTHSSTMKAVAKKAKPLLPIPANATKEIYQSIFTSSGSRSNLKETYSCRALPLARN